MTLKNRLFIEEVPDTTPRVPFHTLRVGDRYQHSSTGRVSLVFKADFDGMTIKREDGWLCRCEIGSFIWDKMVIRVAPLRK